MKDKYEIGELVKWKEVNKLFVGIYLGKCCDKHSDVIVKICDGKVLNKEVRIETSKLKPIVQ